MKKKKNIQDDIIREENKRKREEIKQPETTENITESTQAQKYFRKNERTL